jgi:HAE1 family hydrophobic/amphiphilic exporter-1
MVFALAVVLLYLFMGMQFESFSLPLLLLVTLPLGISGVGFGLLLAGDSINLNSSLGTIVLMGQSVNNAIILYEVYAAMLARKGTRLLGAIYRGSARRIRSIMITVLTTVLALVPMAWDPYGRSTQSSLAISIVCGLSMSTILSLFLVPRLFYSYLKARRPKP